MSVKDVSVMRLKPLQYVHVHNNNSNVTRLVVGPVSYTREDHEAFVSATPLAFVAVPPRHYCVIANPVVRKDGEVQAYSNGQVKIRTGDRVIRFEGPPFPLYPGEELEGAVTPLEVLTPLQALRVTALADFETDDGVKRVAGNEWTITGPCTYYPRVEEFVTAHLEAITVTSDKALRLQARFAFTDRTGAKRAVGEEWLHETEGAFLPWVEEEVVEEVARRTLTQTTAFHVRAVRDFTDKNGKKRVAGSMWLVCAAESPTFIPTPAEEVVTTVDLIVLRSKQYAVVQDPVDAALRNRAGAFELRKGPCSFFLHPGETLEDGCVKDAVVLQDDEALVLTAASDIADDGFGKARKAGTKWLLHGPASYIPPIGLQKAFQRRKAIPLDKTEGVYIRDNESGKVRAHIGSTVMLNEHEELWSKPLPPIVEELLELPGLTKLNNDAPAPRKPRVQYRVVTCNIPHNAICQVYDFTAKKARVVEGPALVMLHPDEEFTVCSFSGGKPKRGDVIKSLVQRLGPDFMTDILVVETKDHARLQLQLSYNWEFQVKSGGLERVFNVPDFVGDACKAIASRVRGAVATVSFDEFHRNSTSIIRASVFGVDEKDGKPLETLQFDANDLLITSVDIHSVDPVDPKTREALTKSVQLAIEITTKSQEATARHLATSLEQQAHGKLERQIIADKALAEEIRKQLLSIEAENASIESAGSSTAAAKAEAEAKLIEGQNEVDLATKKMEAEMAMAQAEIDVEVDFQANEADYLAAIYEIETTKAREMAKIEAEKFQKTIKAVGRETIKSLARAGPATQAKLLKALGLQGYLVTDGSNPINLFNTARGLAASATDTSSLAARSA